MKSSKRYLSNKLFLLIAFQLLVVFYAFSQEEYPPLVYDTSQVVGTVFTENYIYDDRYAIANVMKLETVTINVNNLLGISELTVGETYTFSFNLGNYTPFTGVWAYVTSPCACLVFNWDKRPIPPGQTGFIKITYTATIPGNSEKRVKAYLFDPSGVKPMAKVEIIVAAKVAQIQDPQK